MKKFLFSLTLLCFLTYLATSGYASGFTLRAPDDELYFQGFDKEFVKIKVLQWYCTEEPEKLSEEVTSILKEITFNKTQGINALPLKRKLLSIAEGLKERASSEAVEFWQNYKTDRKKSWLWQGSAKRGYSKEFKENSCYSLKELKEAKRLALQWADYVIKTFGYLGKTK